MTMWVWGSCESDKFSVVLLCLPRLYFNLGNGDDSLGGGGLFGLLGSSELDLGGDAVKVTATLAGQAPSTIGILLCQLQTLECLKLDMLRMML